MVVAFFDFDGTITRGDSFALFLRFMIGKKFIIKIIQNLPSLILYKLKMQDNTTTKEKILSSCLKNMDIDYFNTKCNDFTAILKNFCKDSALQKIHWHKESGHRVIMVSASFEEYLRPFCNTLNIELLATKMEVKNNKLTGKLASPNCYGKEKERRIREYCNLASFKSIYVYGDTKGDKEMLALASPYQAFYRVFN
ncbi:HAD-IB family hydrolase [Helicobacter muridarum]|uniref:HAD hydrolase, family IB n=1 Tax=Helicobacter muridarum TaxID=216 RepID=A0A099U003_9HELI|nr:HAD-IB family hydrolase [Helicobacter muridarum]TLD99565.1 HAD-IB family hydrolase [Helicobacter muridarum]STQ85904.1 HAD hydrolase, family IB [Helicobacter muridarum]